MKNLTFFALSLALAGPGASLAAPAEIADTGVLAVRHGDLNLTKERDARLMIQRLDAAAANVCGASSLVSLAQKQGVRNTKCYQQSMNRALADLGSPTVSALYSTPAMKVASN